MWTPRFAIALAGESTSRRETCRIFVCPWQLVWVWTLCAVILKLGNVEFGGEDEAEAKVIHS